MAAHSCTPMWTWADSGGMGYTFLPALLAPSYLQAKQSEATKRSPPWAATPNPAVESPKTKGSGGKGGHHCSLGHSSNTSTPKCSDSTSAKKPSSSKKPAPKEQDKSPKNCGSHPPHLPNQLGVSRKRPMQKSPANSTPPSPLAPVGLMAFAVQWGPTARQPGSSLPPSPQPPGSWHT